MFVAVTRPSSKNQLQGCADAFKGLDQQVAIFFRRESSQKKRIPVGFDPKALQKITGFPVAQLRTIRNIGDA